MGALTRQSSPRPSAASSATPLLPRLVRAPWLALFLLLSLSLARILSHSLSYSLALGNDREEDLLFLARGAFCFSVRDPPPVPAGARPSTPETIAPVPFSLFLVLSLARNSLVFSLAFPLSISLYPSVNLLRRPPVNNFWSASG